MAQRYGKLRGKIKSVIREVSEKQNDAIDANCQELAVKCNEAVERLKEVSSEIDLILEEEKRIHIYGDFERAEKLGEEAEDLWDRKYFELDIKTLLDEETVKPRKPSGISEADKTSKRSFTSHGRRRAYESDDGKNKSPKRNARLRISSGYHDVRSRSKSSINRDEEREHLQNEKQIGKAGTLDVKRKPTDTVKGPVCPFCKEQRSAFSESKNLEEHYQEYCKVLTNCPDCNRVVEISKLNTHYQVGCPKKKKMDRKPCPVCDLQCTPSEIKNHTEKQLCPGSYPLQKSAWCPLCHDRVSLSHNDSTWRQHLTSPVGCKGNPRGDEKQPKDAVVLYEA